MKRFVFAIAAVVSWSMLDALTHRLAMGTLPGKPGQVGNPLTVNAKHPG